MRDQFRLLLLSIILLVLHNGAAGQTVVFHDVSVGLNHTRVPHTGAPGRGGFHVGANFQFNLNPLRDDTTPQKFYLASSVRYARRNFTLAQDGSGRFGTSFIDLGLGPKFSGQAIDVQLKGQLAIPISNSADKSPSLYTSDDLDGAFAALLGEIYLKVSERVHVGGEVSLLSTVYMSHTSPGSFGSNGRPGLPSTFGHKLKWVGVNVKYVLQPTSVASRPGVL